MSSPETIICKPTPWFTLRAAAMLAMFGVFSVLFFIDGTTGYRKKNFEYYLHANFRTVNDEFSKMNSDGSLTAEAWKAYAIEQTVTFPEDRSILPADLELPMLWPEVLTDYEKMKPLQWTLLWQEYSGENRMSGKPVEQPYDAGKIREQIIVLWICLALFIITLFFLIRTLGRSLRADDEALTTVQGKRISYSDFKTLDLRKWDTKGIALAHYDGSAGKGTVRIDGLTYGGFKAENGQPAEELMRRVRSKFSGEIIEYAAVEEDTETGPGEASENPSAAEKS